ncbi:signal peptidase II [Vagococcus entomophilus]|uniref:Lipoprotein signal peptidase n=1 Tax=Vagococcus entomophilus TaxID=1160095 RepID=A0A430AJS2_9ENTE|nr:signal peptidase II [Vagococcus entomophilus]RSU08167.1 signal peptidase II [Vagococcus entomophilus]
MIGYLVISLIIVILDQASKFWVVKNLDLGEQIFNQNGLISITHIRNNGAAWSILEGQMWFFTVITIVAVVVVLYLLYRNINQSKWLTVGLSLILGGALGNFIDRIRLGYVVDMIQIDFFRFPIFNLADTALSLGVVCILIYVLLDEKKNKQVMK